MGGLIAADKPSVLGHRVRVFTRYGDATASEGMLTLYIFAFVHHSLQALFLSSLNR